MDRWEDVALISFIACDIIVENSNEFKLFYTYKYKILKNEIKDIIWRVLRYKWRWFVWEKLKVL